MCSSDLWDGVWQCMESDIIRTDKATHKVVDKVKKIKTTLDEVPFGTDEQIEHMTQRYTKELPENVRSSMLYKDILKIAWPSMVERALAAIGSMIAMMMVGNLGPWAIASVGLASLPRMLLITMIMAMHVGSTAMIARSRGADSREKANAYFGQAVILGIVGSIIFGAVGYASSELLIKLMGASEEATLIGGVTFLRIQCAGFVFIGIPITITAALRGIGNTRVPMIYNMIAAGINVLLNFLLIEGRFGFPALGIAGASIAMLAGQAVASVIAICFVLRKNNYIYLDLKKLFKVNLNQQRDILRIGMPAVGEQVILRMAMILVNRVIASLGTNDFAAHQICMNFLNFTIINGESLSTSATMLMGQSIGKKRPDMAQAYTSRCRRTGLVFALFLAAMFVILRHPLTKLYTEDAAIIETSVFVILILAVYQPFQASQYIVSGALRGAGDTFAIAVLNFFCALLLRPTFAAVAVYYFGLGVAGAWYAFLADQILRSILISRRFSSGKWKKVFHVKKAAAVEGSVE